MSENFVLPSVSTRRLLREGANVPEHLRDLPAASPQLQVLAMQLSSLAHELLSDAYQVDKLLPE